MKSLFYVPQQTSSASATPGGGDTQVQFNDAGALNGDSKLTFDKTAGVLSLAGIGSFSPQDNAAIPVAPTGPMKNWSYNKTVADDGVVTLPSITNAAFGFAQAGNNEEYALFLIDDAGNVTLLLNSANVVSGADIDTKLCIGTAAAQEPLILKNRLEAAKNVNVVLWFN